MEIYYNNLETRNPLISVIIPTRNRAEMLFRALNSVVTQTYPNIEIIVIDDASTDNTKDLIQHFATNYKINNLIYHRQETQQGAPMARNKGIALSTGNYIAFLDDDDEWLPRKLEAQLILHRELLADITYTGYIIKQHGKEIAKKYPEPFDSTAILTRNTLGTFSTVLINREVFNNILFDPSLKSHQDWDFWLQATDQCYHIVPIDACLTIYHLHDSNISQRKENLITARDQIYNKHIKHSVKNPRILSEWHAQRSLLESKLGLNKEARKSIFQAIKLHFRPKYLAYLALTFTNPTIFNLIYKTYIKIRKTSQPSS